MLRAAGLALPLVAFIVVTFLAPLGAMLARSVYDPVVADALPETLAALQTWDGGSIPDEAVFAALGREWWRPTKLGPWARWPPGSTACKAACAAW